MKEGTDLVGIASSVTRSDIERAAALLSLAADRGAFQIQEYQDVGGLWERLQAFLQSSKP